MPPCIEPSAGSQVPVRSSYVEESEKGGNLVRVVGRRKLLVQTDTGNVYGMECDRADDVQAVKRILQPLLPVPTDHVALVCGDLILKNDLHESNNDTHFLFKRKLERSVSSPCLSPTSEFLAEPGSSNVLDVVAGSPCSSEMRLVVREIAKAIQCGVEPVPISGGLGGAYYFRNSKGEKIAIIKPTDEEPFAPNNPNGFVGKFLGQPGWNKAIRAGESGVREVAAYLLDHGNFAMVPPTALVKITHHVFHVNNRTPAFGKSHPSPTKLASCQEYVYHDFDASDRGCSGFSVAAVHRIGILDIRIFNIDRHAGNILVKKVDVPRTRGSSRILVNNALELIPIDHGLCLPESLENPYFEWLHWPQASVAFSDEELDYIRRLDANKDADMLRRKLPTLRAASLRLLILSTTFLQKGAEAGFCLAEIGELMSSDGLEEASQLEMFCLKARQEAESKFLNVTPEDDGYVSNNSCEGNDFQEQFVFEDDTDSFCQSDSSGMHLGTSKCSDLQVPSLTLNVKSLVLSDWSADFKSGNISRGRDVFNKTSPSLGHCFMDQNREAHFKPPCEASSSENEDFNLSLPAKLRTNCASGGRVMSRAVSISYSSDKSLSKSARLNSSRGSAYQCAEKDGVSRRTLESMNQWRTSGLPAKAMSYKSASLSDRKPRSSFQADRGTFGVSASEAQRKANVAGSGSPFSLEDMSEQEWICFMDCFEQILHRDFASRSHEPVGYRQRLGISLPASTQMRLR